MPVDKELVKRRFLSSRQSYERQARVQQEQYGRLLAMLEAAAGRQFSKVLEVGCGTGGFSRELLQRLEIDLLRINDLTLEKALPPLLEGLEIEARLELLGGDAEELDLGAGYDLIASASALQWFDAPLSFVDKAYRSLSSGGYLLIGVYGHDNLRELRELTGVGLDYPDLEAWQEALGERFTLLEAREELIPIYFASPREVLYHLKETGVTAVGGAGFRWTKERLHQFEADYEALFTSERGLSLHYHPIYLLARKG